MVGSESHSICQPRLCQLYLWPHFEGYGFNLHAEKSRPGQYIGKVDEGSPAAAAGLKDGDRIIEVNSVNISQENHKQVVSRIKADGSQTLLLVVDKETDTYYKELGKTIKESDAIRLSSEIHDNETDNQSQNSDSSEKKNSKDIRLLVTSPETNEYMTKHGIDFRKLDSSFTVTDSSLKNEYDSHSSHLSPPRLCHVTKWPHFSGFGFSLTTNKKKGHQYISCVDENGPGFAAGLRLNDVILSVNGVKVAGETHKEVVDRIKASSQQTSLLLIDSETESYCYTEGLSIDEQFFLGINCDENSKRSSVEHMNNNNNNTSNGDSRSQKEVSDNNEEGKQENERPLSANTTNSECSENSINSPDDFVLNLNMTAAEMRQRIGAKKRRDPRKDDEKMDFRKKYEIIQTL